MTFGIRYTEPAEGLDLDARNRELRHLLLEHDCEITFTKVNGETRTMPCTLRAEAMPKREADTLQETRLYKPETLSVFCLDKSEWRSFRVANVQEIRVLGS